jgi:hypothetical protein
MNIWKPKLEKKTHKAKKKELDLDNSNDFNTGLNTDSEEYLRRRMELEKVKVLKQIEELESNQLSLEEAKKIIDNPNISKGDSEIDLDKKEQIYVSKVNDLLVEKKRYASDLRDKVNMEHNLQFYLDAVDQINQNINKYSPQELEKWQENLEHAIEVFPYETTIHITLLKLYIKNLKYEDSIQTIFKLLESINHDYSKFTFEGEHTFLKTSDITIFKQNLLKYLVDAYSSIGKYEEALFWSKEMNFSIDSNKFLFKLKNYKELISTYEDRLKDIREEFIDWDSDRTPFEGYKIQSNEFRPDFVNLCTSKISTNLDLLYLKYLDQGNLNNLSQDYFNIKHDIYQLVNILKLKNISENYIYETTQHLLDLAYLSTKFGEYKTALTLYNSIDPKEYFDKPNSQNKSSDTKTKEPDENNQTSNLKLLIANGEGRNLEISLELGKIVSYFELNKKELAHRSLENLITAFKENKKELSNSNKTDQIDIREYQEYANIISLEEKTSDLNKLRNDYFDRKLEYSVYLDAINELVEWISETYLNKFVF